jgi:hypothetical protein
MNLENKELDEWLTSIEVFNQFPNNYNYPRQYGSISDQLYKWVHENVSSGAQAVDGTFLTNHGSDHIRTLISKATKFVEDNEFCDLTPWETYILLLAIHVHDVGNIYVREGHELNSREIVKLIGDGVVDQDRIVWDYVIDIAAAHKGFQIEQLPYDEYIHGKNVRVQLLAAIVKFADELSDYTGRANLLSIKLSTTPEPSLIYHHYARCLHSVVPKVKSREILMNFYIEEDLLTKLFIKENEAPDIYLIDEIYLRTMKTYLERVYCSKFLRPYITFDSIKVKITVRHNNGRKSVNGYELCESGLIDVRMDEVFRLCPELKQLTGKKYHENLSKRNE